MLRLLLNILLPLSGWILLCLLGPWLLKFFLPFVVGWIIASIANPPVRFLEQRLKLVRRHSSILVVVSVLAAVIGLLYLLLSRTVRLISSLIQSLPEVWEVFQRQIRQSMESPTGLFAFLPDRAYMTLMRYERYGFLALLVIMYLDVGSRFLTRAIVAAYQFFWNLVL